jgi:hypothetical protein
MFLVPSVERQNRSHSVVLEWVPVSYYESPGFKSHLITSIISIMLREYK